MKRSNVNCRTPSQSCGQCRIKYRNRETLFMGRVVAYWRGECIYFFAARIIHQSVGQLINEAHLDRTSLYLDLRCKHFGSDPIASVCSFISNKTVHMTDRQTNIDKQADTHTHTHKAWHRLSTAQNTRILIWYLQFFHCHINSHRLLAVSGGFRGGRASSAHPPPLGRRSWRRHSRSW